MYPAKPRGQDVLCYVHTGIAERFCVPFQLAHVTLQNKTAHGLASLFCLAGPYSPLHNLVGVCMPPGFMAAELCRCLNAVCWLVCHIALPAHAKRSEMDSGMGPASLHCRC